MTKRSAPDAAETRSRSDSSSSGSSGSSKEGLVVKRRKSRQAPSEAAPKNGGAKGFERVRNLLRPGTLVVGRIDGSGNARIKDSSFVELRVLPWCFVRLLATEIHDVHAWKTNPLGSLRIGDFVRCVVLDQLEKSRDGAVIDVSTRPSLLSQLDVQNNRLPNHVLAQEREQASSYPKEGELVKGFIEKVNEVGAFVRISRGISAMVPLKHLADRFIAKEALQKEFPNGMLVAGRVLHSNANERKLILSLRASSVLGKEQLASIETLETGQVYEGTLKSVTEYGVFVRLDETADLSGLVHRTQLMDGKLTRDHRSIYEKGDRVKVCVLSVDKEKRRISLSMKASKVLEAMKEMNQEDDEEAQALKQAERKDSDDSDSESVLELLKSKQEIADDETKKSQGSKASSLASSPDDESDDAAVMENVEEEPMSLQDALKLTKAAQSWADPLDESAERNDEEETSTTENQADSGKKSSKRRNQEKALIEAETAAKEQEKLEEPSMPQSVDEFERLLVGSPNSSLLWIQYMSFLTAQVELNQARVIAQRALSTINYRLEGEKQNVLLALLRLECNHGTPQTVEEAMTAITERMDKDSAFLEIATVLEDHGDFEKADATLKKAVKAVKGESEVPWLRRVGLKFRQKDISGAQQILKNAKGNNLGKKLLVQLYLGYARFEFSNPELGGDPERARTILEALVDENPKRNDLLIQYIDMETKFGKDPNRIRELYERATSMGFSIRKTRTFFKKWLIYETKHGSPNDVEDVKQKARNYVASVENSDRKP